MSERTLNWALAAILGTIFVSLAVAVVGSNDAIADTRRQATTRMGGSHPLGREPHATGGITVEQWTELGKFMLDTERRLKALEEKL